MNITAREKQLLTLFPGHPRARELQKTLDEAHPQRHKILAPGEGQDAADTFGKRLAKIERQQAEARAHVAQLREMYERDCRLLNLNPVPQGALEASNGSAAKPTPARS